MRGMALVFSASEAVFSASGGDTRRIRPRSELHFVEVGEPRYSKFGSAPPPPWCWWWSAAFLAV